MISGEDGMRFCPKSILCKSLGDVGKTLNMPRDKISLEIRVQEN